MTDAIDPPAIDTAAIDVKHLSRALELASRGLYTTDPNPRVGCVLVRHGRVVGEGWHQRAGEPHAEVLALRSANGDARDATAYVTLEPCSHTGRTPPCADALIAAGVARVVCAAGDPNPVVAGNGFNRLRDAGIAVGLGVLAQECRALNVGYYSRFERGRPFIRLKLAMSLDARTSPAGGGERWISGEGSRADVQAWRARSSAVLTGAGTVRLDDPRLDVRLHYGPWVRQPLRVVLDPELSIEPSARVYSDGNALIFAAAPAATPQSAACPSPTVAGAAVAGAAVAEPRERHGGHIPVVRVPRSARGLDLAVVIARLAALEINELLVECGPRLAAAFIEADLVDELILYVAATLLGCDAAPLTALTGLAAAGPLPRFAFREQRLIDGDLRLLLARNKE